MASIERGKSESWNIRFRFSGRKFNRSLNTTDERKAKAKKGRIEETLMLLADGHKTLPDGLTHKQAGKWIMSGGRLTEKPTAVSEVSIERVCNEYFDSIPEGAKEPSSIKTENTHTRNLMRHLKPRTPIQSVDVKGVQSYIKSRQKDKGQNGKTIQPDTIRKELVTLRLIWSFSLSKGYVKGECPIDEKKLQLPKADEKLPFKTWGQINNAVQRGGISDEQVKELWNSLFLRSNEIKALLKYVKKHAEHPFIYPMFAFAAFTGARRSEILRSQIDDFHFDQGLVLIREKKRRKYKKTSFRFVQLHDQLKDIMSEWFDRHPGGIQVICAAPHMTRSRNKSIEPQPLTENQAHYYFKQTLAQSKWTVIRGFHVLRHSFASILASKGVYQSIIDRWMGHQTEEMRERYRHLFPEETSLAINTLSF